MTVDMRTGFSDKKTYTQLQIENRGLTALTHELAAALRELLNASIEDSGDPDKHDDDDGCVGWSRKSGDEESKEMALTFAILRKSESALTRYTEMMEK